MTNTFTTYTKDKIDSKIAEIYNNIAHSIPAFSAVDKDITTIPAFIFVMNHAIIIGTNAVRQTAYKENANTFEINNTKTYCLLGDHCFEHSNVTKAKFAHGVRCGGNVFLGCKNLTTFDCEQCFEVIYGLAFAYCDNLKSVVIRKGFTGLSNVNVFNSTPIADSNTEGFIYVADDLVNTYKTATNWVAYADKIKPLSEYTEA